MGYDGSIVISADIETKQFDKQIEYIESQLEEIEYSLKQADLGFEVGDTQKLESEYEKLSNRLIDLKTKKEQFNDTPMKSEDIASATSTLEKGITRITKKITKMGLAMIGIRSLYGMVASSVSRIKEEDEGLKTQIEAIQNAVDNVVYRLVQVLLPVIELIVGFVGELMQNLFGVDIYAKSFSKSMKSGTKAAKELRKQLLGFDEMNILNKDGSVGGLGTGGTGGGTTGTTGGIKDIKQQATNTIFGIAETIADSLRKGTGVGGGLAELIFGKNSVVTKGVKIFNKASWGISGIIADFLTGKLGKKAPKNAKELLETTDGMFGTMADKLKGYFSDISVSYKDGMYEVTTSTGETVRLTEQEYKELMEVIGTQTSETFTTGKDSVMSKVIGTFTSIKDSSNTNANNTKTNWINAGKDIITKYSGGEDSVMNKVIGAFDSVVNGSKKDSDDTKKNWIDVGKDIITTYTGGENSVMGKVISTFKDIPQSAETNTKSAFSNVTNFIKNYTPPKKTVSIQADTLPFINEIKKLAKASPVLFLPIVNALKAAGYKVAKGGIINPPRLASGGIINQPGRGVAIGGERGREAVIPLTDSQQMEYLGNEIAKHIRLNLTNVTELDGRVIARSVSEVMSDMNFASNGGVI